MRETITRRAQAFVVVQMTQRGEGGQVEEEEEA